MSTIQPQGEDLRKAVRWISEERQSGTTLGNDQLVNQAAVKFNLSPLEVEYLTKFVREQT